MSRFNKYAKAIRDAVDNGIDPETIELNDAVAAAQGGKAKPPGNQQPRDFFLSHSHLHKLDHLQISLTLEKTSAPASVVIAP